MRDSLLRFLLLLPVLAGLPLLAWAGVLSSTCGLLFGTAALASLLHATAAWLLHPRQALASHARQLAPGGPQGADDWAQIDACLRALGRQRELDRAQIRELEARLHLGQAVADGAATAKRTFLANIGHEIRTPLNVVVGMTRLALKQATAQQHDHLLRADRAAQELLTHINNLLDVVKLECGELRLEQFAFSPADLLSQLVAIYADQAQRKGLALRPELDARLPAVLVGDPERLRQVLASLTDNALKFTDSGEIVVALTLQGHAGRQPRVGFEVRDTGIGIAPDKQASLFELFRQGDPSLTRRQGGTGLGLNLCSRLVQAMGGVLELDSRPGAGSSFRFEVALAATAAAATLKAAEEVAPADAAPEPRTMGPQLSAIGVELAELGALLADFDAAAINAFERMRRRLSGSVPEQVIETLQDAINGFDFVTAGKLLEAMVEDLGLTPSRAP